MATTSRSFVGRIFRWGCGGGCLLFLAFILLMFIAPNFMFRAQMKTVEFLTTRTQPYQPPVRVFDGSSADLKRTVIVPTLETLIEAGRNIVWCSSVQMAWNELRKPYGNIRLRSAETICDQLNTAANAEVDLPPENTYIAAGLATKGLEDTIRSNMARRFPDAMLPDFDVLPDDEYLAFAYLVASIPFPLPFFDNDRPLAFRDSLGKETPLASFGVFLRGASNREALRNQVDILYDEGEQCFVVDPSKTSSPFQIVLAMVPLRATLAETIADVEQKVSGWKPDWPNARELGPNSAMLIPVTHWRVQRRFAELEGKDKPFLNPGLEGKYLRIVSQIIDFKLDRCGATVTSSVVAIAGCQAHDLIFDRPFLMYLKKRGGSKPFFAMWVDNAELLNAFRP